jgi:23S rRNA (cytidine1920-2'-O)/16S rRNA (cytidine1409-2'-O)-methyltransferase
LKRAIGGPVVKPGKERLDKELVARGLATTRERAQGLILSGNVLVDEKPVDKPGTPIAAGAVIRIRGDDLPYVSRGGLKLVHALEHFALDVTGALALDVGASTGGFTDCLLQRGAARVCAVDVGYGQLAWSLRQDPRVTLIERQNVRALEPSALPFVPTLGVIDVSFISLRLLLPKLAELLPPGAPLVALIKPQFEVGKGAVGKGGVVRDLAARAGAVEAVLAEARRLAWTASEAIESPIQGPAGNVEYLALLGAPTRE